MRASPTLLVLQHIECEPPGAYEDELRDGGGALVRAMVDQGEALPEWRDFDGIVVMGGPMGAYEDERLAWLSAEKRLIAAAVNAGVPFWGVCLGSQLLAASLGAAVGPGPEPEVGVLPVVRCADAVDDPVFDQAPASFPALQWHGDTFELPVGARRLARSDAYENQAFAVRRAYGLQFHIEIGIELARLWGDVPAYAQSLETMMGADGLARLLGEVEAHAAEMTALARRLFGAWLANVVAPYSAQRAAVA
jgi:GMP synthase-like glutamine amidotransferase